jgi:hypothetical protein
LLSPEDLARIEAEIDAAFANNALANLPFAQGVWTLLSVVEDLHFKITIDSSLEANQVAIYVDGLINALTYPLRVCYQRAAKGPLSFTRELVDEHYILVNNWLDVAEGYDHVCSIFPLYRAGQIDLRVEGSELIPTDWSASDLSYEAYDRFIAKRDPDLELILDDNLVSDELRACMDVNGGVYSVDFTRRLMDKLASSFGPSLAGRHTLPKDWTFSCFSLSQFRSIFTCLQFMAHAWSIARHLAVFEGVPAIVYASALWTPRKGWLVTRIARQTGIRKSVVSDVLRYLTFGEVGIRNPDIAIQPIVDLTNGEYAISPFVMANVHSERNLCVLLNQIPAERKLYSQLVEQKEHEIRTETIASLSSLGLDFRHGRLTDTDVDLAIIDHETKTCLCIEIKWFIEPAEIREVLARSEELVKGVGQALKIARAFRENDGRLMALLGIDPSFDFLSMVGSVNFIGGHRVQDPGVPIMKLWHLVSEIKKRGRLGDVFEWLKNRSYLPRKDEDYKVQEIPIQVGQWHSRWYGISSVS